MNMLILKLQRRKVKHQHDQQLPKWNRRARLGQFVGFSDEHSSLVANVWHLTTGYTTYKTAVNISMDDTIQYYATEYMDGEKRNDYAMINFVSDDGITATCPEKILWFV